MRLAVFIPAFDTGDGLEWTLGSLALPVRAGDSVNLCAVSKPAAGTVV